MTKAGLIAPDWKGKLERRFVLRRFRFEWGRWCYQTDHNGETLARWWESSVEKMRNRRIQNAKVRDGGTGPHATTDNNG